MTTPLAVVDCPTGLAGNMLLAALFDLGLPHAAVDAPLAALGLEGRYRLALEERRSGGLRGLHLAVESLEAEPPHRHWSELRARIAAAPLQPPLRERILAVFTGLAEAEAAVHGHAPEQVHFHEVGALDALVDVVGVCAGLAHFGVERLICAVPPAGHGTVRTAHGVLPLPAPAVLELARRGAIPLASSAGFPAGELTTPTGLALMAALADGFGPAPALVPRAVGVGLGSRSLDRPNLLRLVLGEAAHAGFGASAEGLGGAAPGTDAGLGAAAPRLETVLEQQAQIDDASPEDLAFLADALREAGALEVFSQPILMKKGRPGLLLSVIAWPEQAEALRAVWWRHGSSLGVREQWLRRWALPRSSHTVSTAWGPVRIKTARRPDGGLTHKPEYGDLADLARRHGLPLAQLRQAALAALAASPPPDPNADPTPFSPCPTEPC
ncbi:nickel pincer cofactor biosynthesis protein LarC [Vulcanococcus limneticus]|uniref:nickel pincer cofactor biosynthesis protein LarC n=1 Tax=Vulcanococcus limneticus TaxID=2170428 RepID=UPI00398C06CB